MYHFLVTFLILITLGFSTPATARKKIPWGTEFAPGDKVCLYDVSKSDPLVDKSDLSFKYFYRSPLGDQQSRYQLRPSVRDLLLRVLWPGLTVDGTPDLNGNFWFSGSLVVISGGYQPGLAETYVITRGKNTLLVEKNRSWVKDWQVLHFKQVRLRKKKFARSCKRKYEIY